MLYFFNTFIAEFAEYLESFVVCTEPVLICGEFNIHVDNQANPNIDYTTLRDPHTKTPDS